MNKIELMKNGYDPFIDFLKGFCILSVICNHCLNQLQDYILFPYWGNLAVPLFLILQSYHVFRKNTYIIRKPQIINMIRRIFVPFLCVTMLEFLLQALLYDYPLGGLVKSYILWGGRGPGSYYCWIYLQFFVLVPCVYWLITQFNVNYIKWGGICNYLHNNRNNS